MFSAGLLTYMLFFLSVQEISGQAEPTTQLEFQLRDVNGQLRTEKEWKDSKFVVLFFMDTECPVSKLYVPEMNRIAEKYSKQQVVFYGIISDPEASAKHIRKHAKEYKFTFPVLLDPAQTFAQHTRAKRVPEAALLNNRGELFYGGRIDDWYLLNGRRRREPRKRDLREALDAVIAGKQPRVQRTKAFGCPLPALPGQSK
ncbi:MAG: redoxin domain-containing protein [Gemmataceae bacterium]